MTRPIAVHTITVRPPGAPPIQLRIEVRDGSEANIPDFYQAWQAAWKLVPDAAKKLIVEAWKQNKREQKQPFGMVVTLVQTDNGDWIQHPEWDQGLDEPTNYQWSFPCLCWPGESPTLQRRVVLQLLVLEASILSFYDPMLCADSFYYGEYYKDVVTAWETGKAPKALRIRVKQIDRAMKVLQATRAAILPAV